MKQLFRSFLHRLGFDLVRYAPTAAARAVRANPKQKGSNLFKSLTLHEIDFMLDVGANVGQFALHMYEIGYEGRIVSVEPVMAARERLLEASVAESRWQIAERCALGDRNGETELHVAQDAKHSSVLTVLPQYLEVAPKAAAIATETVPLHTVNGCLRQYRGSARNPFLRISVQGYEDRVLDGAEAVLPEIEGLHIEFSFLPLYQDQGLFDELFAQIKGKGFSLYNLYPSFSDYRTGKILRAVGIFFREIPH